MLIAVQRKVLTYLFNLFPQYETEKARRALSKEAIPTEEEKVYTRLKHAEEAFSEEMETNSFPWIPTDLLRAKHVLDLGCDVGGRSVAWAQIFGFGKLAGVETTPEAVSAARTFAERKGVCADFRVGYGEDMPFESETFDAVMSNDVLEHVRSPEHTLAECARVLKPGGVAILRFPQRLHPFESHLGHITNPYFPFHWVFSPKAIRQAYCKTVIERGIFEGYKCEPWEWLPTLNGLSVRAFRRLLRDMGWTIAHWEVHSYCRRRFRPLGAVLRRMASIPLVEEVLLHRICAILRRPEVIPAREAIPGGREIRRSPSDPE